MVLTAEDLAPFKPIEYQIYLEDKQQWEFLNQILSSKFWNGWGFVLGAFRCMDHKIKTKYIIQDKSPTVGLFSSTIKLFEVLRTRKNKWYIQAVVDHPIKPWRWVPVKISPAQKIILVTMFPDLMK